MENVKERNREPNLIVFAKQNFTPLQKDRFTLAVMQLETGFNVQPDLFQNKTVTVTTKMLSEVAVKKYDRVKAECKSLALKVIEISDDEKEEFEFIVPFPRIKYSKGVIELTMLSDVAQKFLELKNGYSDYYVRESLSLEQFNKKRLYELFSSYKGRKINVWTVYDNELKGLLGMDVKEYDKRPKQFEEQIILVCVNAINEKTSISVAITERGKNSEGWFTTFTISEKNKSAKAIGQAKSEYNDLDEKSQRCYDEVTKLGVSPKLRMRIVTEYQAETWKWLGDNKENLKNNFFRNPPGVLLVYLGLAEGKVTNPRNIKVKKETPAVKPAPVAPQPGTQKSTGVNKGIDLRKTVTFTNEADMIEAYDVIRLLTTDDSQQIGDVVLQEFWKAANPDVTKIVSVNNKEWFACREYKNNL